MTFYEKTMLLMDTQLDDQQREFIATLRMSGEAPLTIINDILDFSEIKAGKIKIERTTFDVRSRCVSDLAAVRSACNRAQIEPDQ